MRKNITVFIDIETGGREFRRPIIQVAAIAVRNWEEIDVFERKILFSPDECSKEALEINHYDPEVWKTSGIAEPLALAQLDKFLRDHADVEKISQRGKRYKVARLAGHNVREFDSARLRAAFKRSGLNFFPADYHCLDTLHFAIWKLHEREDEPENYRLETLCKYLDIECDGSAHEALTDVRMSIALAKALLEI